ncbi:MAG: Crp/Fnr family transcriptional regulator [Bacteroidetes bacterium]|nr:Crp/Fnr family transcriptional regulator [Bacteroidota bacterium]
MVLPEKQELDVMRSYISAFVPLNDDDWHLLAPHLCIKTLSKNHFLLKENKTATELGFVLEGMLRQYYTKDGEEKTTYFFFENMFIGGYISCITGKPSLITIEALSNTRYISIPYTVLSNLYESSLAWQKFGRLIAEYATAGLEERMVGLLTLSPEERYIELLQSNKKRIIERIPQHYIANYLGITPVSMSRIRNRLMKK